MKKIIFINQDSGYLMIDIVNAFADEGYSCVLLTGRLIERDTPLRASVKIEKIIKYNRTSTLKRLVTWGIGFVQIWTKIALKYRKSKLFIVSNPPFATLLPRLIRNPFSLLIFDIYPDALSELGYLSRNSRIISWWSKLNKKVFPLAEKVFTITDSMKDVLLEYTKPKPVEVVPLWTSNTFFKPIEPTENPFIKKHNLSGKFVVLYSGNLGLSGDVDNLIDVAAKVERDNIAFVIIGEGAKRQKIQEKLTLLKLKNVHLLPWQPVDELPFSLSSASLAVVSLGVKASKLVIPSKIYNFFSVGAPLLCMTAKGSEVENLVDKYDCGKSFQPDNINEMSKFIIDLADQKDLHRVMKTNSLKASKDYNISNVKKFLTTLNYG